MATRALLYRRPAEPAKLLVKHGSQFFAIRLRRHRRARRYTLRIHPTDREAILTMPPRGTLAEAKDFAQLHGGWIAARLGRLPKAAPFQAGHRGAVARRAAPDRASRRRARHGVDGNPRQRREDHLRRRRRRAYRPPRARFSQARSAQGSAQGLAAPMPNELGVRVKRVSIRDQSSRWGSCTSAGSLSFSWRLILAPPYVLDYLAAHEVAHLVEMNHSPRFWKVVAKVCAMSSAPRAGSTPTATTCIATGSRIRAG